MEACCESVAAEIRITAECPLFWFKSGTIQERVGLRKEAVASGE